MYACDAVVISKSRNSVLHVRNTMFFFMIDAIIRLVNMSKCEVRTIAVRMVVV